MIRGKLFPRIAWMGTNVTACGLLCLFLLGDLAAHVPTGCEDAAKLGEGYEEFDLGGLGRFRLDDEQGRVKQFLRAGLAWHPRTVLVIREHVAKGSTMHVLVLRRLPRLIA